MTQVLGLRLPSPITLSCRRHCNSRASAMVSSNPVKITESISSKNLKTSWDSLRYSLRCKPRFSCLFFDNSKQDQARKSLESALGEKKTEFEKWDKEIKKREEASAGGNSGGGGWFGWGGWFGGSNGDHFWEEAQQISFTILGMIALYLIFAKGDVILAVMINPLLFLLRGTRNGLTLLTSLISGKVNPAGNMNAISNSQERVTAVDSVVRKWGSG